MEEAIIKALVNAPGIRAIVSDRVAWDEAHSSWAMPYLVVHHISDQSIESNDGPAGTAMASIQINCVAATIAEALRLRRAVQHWFGNYHGTHDGVELRTVERQSKYTIDSSILAGKPSTVHVKVADYLVWYTEEVSVTYS